MKKKKIRLYAAAIEGKTALAQSLIENNTDMEVDMLLENGETTLQVAAKYNHRAH